MGDIFSVKYNEKLDRLEIPKKRGTGGIWNFVREHKFFSIVLMSVVIFAGINFYLIFSFMKILESVWKSIDEWKNKGRYQK